MTKTKKAIIGWAIKLFKCDTARITSPCSTHFMIIGHNRHTKDDEVFWVSGKTKKRVDYSYVAETVIASGKTLSLLMQSIKNYYKLTKIKKITSENIDEVVKLLGRKVQK